MPKGPSLQARLLVLAFSRDLMDWVKIRVCQQQATNGMYAAAFAGYVQWLASRYEEIRRDMPARVAELRDRASGSGQHRRTPGIVANLFFGLEVFAGFPAVDATAMTQNEADEFLLRAWAALGEATAQVTVRGRTEPVPRCPSSCFAQRSLMSRAYRRRPRRRQSPGRGPSVGMAPRWR